MDIKKNFNLDLFSRWFVAPMEFSVSDHEKNFNKVKKNIAPSLLHAFQALSCGSSDRHLSNYMSGIESSDDSILLRGDGLNFLSLVRKEFKGQKTEMWTPHSFNGAPAQFLDTQKCVEVVWMKNGACHRDNAPAYFLCAPDFILIEWCQDGKWHRDDGPSRILIKKIDKQNATIDFDYHTNHKKIKSESSAGRLLDWLT